MPLEGSKEKGKGWAETEWFANGLITCGFSLSALYANSCSLVTILLRGCSFASRKISKANINTIFVLESLLSIHHFRY